MASPRSAARPALNPRRLPDGVQPAGGPFRVTGITGTRNGDPITGLLSLDTLTGNDNLFSPTAPDLTGFGIAFSVGQFSSALFLSSAAPGCRWQEVPGGTAEPVVPGANPCFDGPSTPVELMVAVPEAATALLRDAVVLGPGRSRRPRR